ncbi:MAG: HAD-IB family hydrolase [Anaerolineales bacterium]|nr:MAG: HAD-IB family hydrolase [Anaerolineales bacterium]
MSKRTVAFFDVDGTLTTERVWRGVLDYYKAKGKRTWTLFQYWVYHMPLYLLHSVGLLSQSAFRTPWAAHLMWFLRGDTPEQAEPVWDWVTTEYMQGLWRAQGLDKIMEHKAQGHLVVLVSAGPQPLVERMARELGADMAVGTKPAVHKGRYTGGVDGMVSIDENKASLARAALADHKIDVDFAASWAYADGSTDVGLLEMAGHPVAFFPDEFLKPIALERGWPVVE